MKSYLFLFMLSAWANRLVANEKTLTIVTDDWCPHVCDSKVQRGYMIEIVSAIFKKANINANFRFASWSRSIHDVRNGKIDALIGMYKRDAPDFIFPKLAFGISDSCAFTPADSSWKFDGIESLKKSKIGVIQDYTYTVGEVQDYLKLAEKEKHPNFYVAAAGGLMQNVKLLQSKRIDVLLEDDFVLYHNLRINKISDNFKKAHCFGGLPLYIGLSPKMKDSEKYIKILENGLNELRSNGELVKILNHYQIQDWGQAI